MPVTSARPEPPETSVPFRAGESGYASFRIPAVVAAHDGTLLAFCEGRVGSRDDFGDIDIVLRRSTDGGRTWGPLQVAAANGHDLAGNPAPVVLASGRVLLAHVRNAAAATEDAIRRGRVSAADGRRVWITHSDDAGRTWTPARDITAQAKKAGWRWYATTPGHAVLTREGRVIVPANHSSRPRARTPAPRGSTTGATACSATTRARTGGSATSTTTPTDSSTSTRPPPPNSPTAASTSTPATTPRPPEPAPTRTPRTAAPTSTYPSGRRLASPDPSSRAASCTSTDRTCCCTRARPTPASAP